MAATAGFDRLNNLISRSNDDGITEFFSVMELPDRQIKERERLASEAKELAILLFALLIEQKESGNVDVSFAKDSFEKELINLLEESGYLDARLLEYVFQISNNITDSTINRLDAPVQDDNYWLSEKRASEIGENISLDVLNYRDYNRAIERGFSRKQWIAMMDEKTRQTHWMASGQIVLIDSFFTIGSAQLFFPHDTVIGNGAEHLDEIINCRCTCKYLR